MYEVPDHGRIKSIHRKNNNIILKQHDKQGYMYVYLRKNNKQYNCRVHRLVALAFLNNPNKYDDVNHIDHNKKNNNLTNLEWSSHKENCYK